MGSAAVVLLCAEDDDLELVRWVHAAREQGLAPEVVTGIERDDQPLLEALGQTTEALFVVLRSPNLSPDRMREIKAAFAKHHRAAQRLVALRLDATAEAAVERIAQQIKGGLRSRSETSLTLAIEEVLPRLQAPTGPHPVIAASRASRAASASRPARAAKVAPVAVPVPAPAPAAESAAPNVPTALDWATEANERATTQRYSIDDETLPLPVVDAITRPRSLPRPTRAPIVLGGLALAVAAALGIAYLLLETTTPNVQSEPVRDSSGRVSMPQPADISAPREAQENSERATPTPALASDDEAPRAPTRRSRPRTAAPAAAPVLPIPSPDPAPAPVVEAPAPPEPEHTTIPSDPAPLEGETPPATP